MFRKVIAYQITGIKIAIVPFRIMSLDGNIAQFVPLMVLRNASILKYIYGKGTEICNQ